MTKKLIYISILVLAGGSVMAQGLTLDNAVLRVSAGAQITLNGGTNGKVKNDGSSQIINAGTINITDEFINKGTATIDNDGIINVAGDWTNNAGNNVFTNRNKVGLAVLNGSSTQTLAGSASTNFENLMINNTTAGTAVSLSADQTVENTINFMDGVVVTGTNNLISSSTVGSVVKDNSDVSFVNGNLRKYVGYSNCLDFDGTDDKVVIPHNVSLNITTAITMEAWINTTSGAEQYIATKQNDSYYFVVNGPGGANKVGFYINGVSAAWLYGTSNVNDGSWHHVAGTWDNVNNLINIYVDGVLENSISKSGIIATGTGALDIGSRTGGNYFTGKIDELRIWNTGRSLQELQHSMNGLLNGNETGLVAYYQFEDGPGSGTLTDVTTNTNDGTLTSMDNNNVWVGNTKHNTFAFPLGDGTSATDYYLIEMEETTLDPGAFTYLDSKFAALATGGTLSLSEEGTPYTSISNEGEWSLIADNVPTSIKYNIIANTANISDLEDNKFSVVKRASGSSDAADWSCTPCGFSADPADGINANGGAGRLVADAYALRRGFTGFSKFGIAKSSVPLPVELFSFKAYPDKDKVNLEWITLSEINNALFTVERSKNGVDWEEIIFVDGAGYSNAILNYSAVDRDPYYGLSYYKLKQTDYNGLYYYSEKVSVMLDETGGPLVIYPNPTTDKITIKSDGEDLLEVEMFNMLGQNVSPSIRVLESNNNYMIIDLKHLSEGNYCLRTKNSSYIINKLRE